MPDATTQLLTNSRMRTFRECARKHDLTYNRRIRPRRESEALRIGTAVHAALENWWRGEDWRPVLDRIEDPFERVKVEVLMEGYDARWFADRDQYEVVAIEAEFEAPLLNPETWAASRTWRLAGKMDGIVRRNGRLAVMEHKTTSDRIRDDSDSYWTRLSMDHQVSAYIVGAESLGYEIVDTLYDVLKKPSLRPGLATPVEMRKFKKGTGELYANQRTSDETPEEYAERMRADVFTDLDSYYQRRMVPRLEEQIRDFMFDAHETAKSIRHAQVAGLAPRNPEACLRYGRCAFWNVCANGEDPLHSSDFEVRDDPHAELSHVIPTRAG